MRDIKFRAFLKLHNKIVDIADLNYYHQKITYEKFENSGNYGSASFQEIELEQYTGLKDCNGKEIYEGDIVSYKTLGSFGESMDNMQGIVVFKDAMFAVLYDKEKGYDDCLCNCMKPVEIIGNIHENPELLEPNQ